MGSSKNLGQLINNMSKVNFIDSANIADRKEKWYDNIIHKQNTSMD